MRGSRSNKTHPSGNPAIVRSIPAVFPQQSYPHTRNPQIPRDSCRPIPVHTSSSCAVNKAKHGLDRHETAH